MRGGADEVAAGSQELEEDGGGTTSLAYVAVAFLSRFWLHEQISLARWAGIALITAGVAFLFTMANSVTILAPASCG